MILQRLLTGIAKLRSAFNFEYLPSLRDRLLVTLIVIVSFSIDILIIYLICSTIAR